MYIPLFLPTLFPHHRADVGRQILRAEDEVAEHRRRGEGRLMRDSR